MATNNNKVQIGIGFKVDKSGLNEINKALQDVINAAGKNNNSGLKTQFEQAAESARKLKDIINDSWNSKLNQLNLNTFNQGLKNAGINLQQVKTSLASMGPQGQAAFNSMATAVLNTNVQLKQSRTLLDSMATSMANTVKWGITAGIFRSVTNSIREAYNYTKNLDTSLVDIRMVTGESADQMQRFAKNANQVSKSLGRSTLDYTKSAVEYYRQGLSDEQVAQRTEITLKAQNITGAGKQMTQYLTAVWNGFKATTDQAERFVDSMAKVADTSASDVAELATAMSKVAATAQTVGVSFDQLNAQIATVVSATRLAPESVGTAFKTIYSRINDIKAGADEAEISLGNYSGRMAQLGINVLDANGNLRDTGEVIEEVGGKWSNLTKEQQTYLASTMGGQRQITQVMALFNNWDSYVKNLNTSLNANGTLNQKNNTYLESTAAHLKQLGAEAERTYNILIDTDAINSLVDSLDGALSIFNDFIQGIGGGTNTLIYFGSLITGIFNKQITQAILQAEQGLQRFMANMGSIKAKENMINAIQTQAQTRAYIGNDTILGDNALKVQSEAAQKTLSVYKYLTRQQQQQSIEIQQQIGLSQQKLDTMKAQAWEKEKELSTDERIINKTEIQLQRERGLLKVNVQRNQQSLDMIKNTEQSLKILQTGSQAWNSTLKADVLNEITLQSKNLRRIWKQAGGDVNVFNNHLQTVTRLIREDKTETQQFKNSWQAIKLVSQQWTAQQREKYSVINEYLTSLNIKQSDRYKLQVMIHQMLEEQNNTLQKQGQHNKHIQMMTRSMSAVGMALSSLSGAVQTFGKEGATAAQKANAAFSGLQGTISAIGMIGGPLGMGISTLVNGAISLLKSAFGDQIEDMFMSLDERVEKYRKKAQEALSKAGEKSKDISSLKEMQEEFAKLSSIAGDYGKNIDDLSDEQKQRYHEIINEFTKMNDKVIVGYDEQGNAIVKNNSALEETIALLEELQGKTALEALGGSAKKYLQGIQNNASKGEYDAQGKAYEQADNLKELLFNTISEDLQGGFFGGLSINNIPNILGISEKELRQIDIDWENNGITQTKSLYDFITEVNDNTLLGISDADTAIQTQSKLILILETLKNKIDESNAYYESIGTSLTNLKNLKIQPAIKNVEEANQKIAAGVEISGSELLAVIKYGQDSYNDAYEALHKSKFYNEGVESLLYDFLKGWSVVTEGTLQNDLDKDNKKGTAQAIVQYANQYIENLTKGLEEIDPLLEKFNLDNHEQDIATSFLTRAKKQIINKILKDESIKSLGPDMEQALSAAISSSIEGVTVKVKKNGNEWEIDTAELDIQGLADQTQESIANTVKNLGFNGDLDLNLINIFSDSQISQIAANLQNLNWSPMLKAIQDKADLTSKEMTEIFKQMVADWEFPENDLPQFNFDFDTFINPSDVRQALDKGKQLKDVQEDYLSIMEASDQKLAKLRDDQGRGSTQYIQRLKQIEDSSLSLYLAQVKRKQAEAQTAIENKNYWEEHIGQIEKTAETQEDLLAAQNSYEQAIKDGNEAQAEMVRLKQQQNRLTAAIAELQKQQAKKQQDRAIERNKQKISNIQGGKGLLEKSKDKTKPALDSNDLKVALYYENINSTLAQIVKEKGAEGRYTEQYQQELAKTLLTQESILDATRLQTQELIKQQRHRQNMNLIGLKKQKNNKERALAAEEAKPKDERDQAKIATLTLEINNLTDDIYDSQNAIDNYDLELAELGQSFVQTGEKANNTAKKIEEVNKTLDKELTIDPSSLYQHLENAKKLSEIQLAYVNRLEDQDAQLKKIAVTQGRSSKEYIEALKLRDKLARELYKKDLQDERDKLLIQKRTYEQYLAMYGDTLTEKEVINAKKEIILLESQILNLDYEIDGVETSITNQVKQQLKTRRELEKSALQLQQKQTQKNIKNVENLKGLADRLKDPTKDVTSQDYATLTFLEEKFPVLAAAAGQDGANRFSEQYISIIEKMAQNSGLIIHNMYADAVAEAQKAVQLAKQEVDEAQAELDKLGNKPSQEQYQNALQILEPKDEKQSGFIAAPDEEQLNAAQQVVNAWDNYQEKEQAVTVATQKLTDEIAELAQAQGAETENIRQSSVQLWTYAQQLELLNSLTNKDNLTTEEGQQLARLLDGLVQKNSALAESARILQNEFLIGTEEYTKALEQVQDYFQQLKYEDLESQIDENLDKITVDIELKDLDECWDQIEEFVNLDRQILIEIKTDAENEFNKLTQQIEKVYNASSKIGQNFIVAADDIRELNSVFPGIMENMQLLSDGTWQLNQQAVQAAIGAASDIVAADSQSVTAQLQSQANLLHSKGVMYQKAADAARILAEAEKNNEEITGQQRAAIFSDLQTARAEMSAEATDAEAQNLSEATTASDQAGSSMSQNIGSAATSMSQSIYQFAVNAIDNLHQVAAASEGVAHGREAGNPIPPGGIPITYSGGVNTVQTGSATVGTINNNFKGTTGGGNGAWIPGISGGINTVDPNDFGANSWSDVADILQDLADSYFDGESQLQGLMAQIIGKVQGLGPELSNAMAGRPSGGTGGSGGGGGGGGGQEPEQMQLLDQQYDIYHDINQQLKRLQNNLEKISRQQDKLVGQDLVDNLNAQLQAIEDINSANKHKLDLLHREQEERKAGLTELGATFDQNGYISNYNQLVFDKINEVNATIEYYNGLTAQQQKLYKDTIDKKKQELENLKSLLEGYDTLIAETIPGLEQQIQDNIDKQFQIRIKQFKVSVDLELEMGKAERDFNKFRKKVIDKIRKDDVLGNTNYLFKDLESYYKGGTGTGQIGALTDQVNKTLDQLKQIDETGTSSVYGNDRAQALKDLQNYSEKLMNSLEDAEDIIEQIENSIFDAIDKTQEAFDNQADIYEHISDLIDHDVKMVKLIYGDKAYDELSKYYEMQRVNDNNHIDMLKQEKDMWYERIRIEQQRMSQMVEGSDDWEKANDRLEEYKEHWMDVTKELNSTVEKSVQNIVNQYSNTINSIFTELEKYWTNNKSMQHLNEQWELINKQADLYLDQVNSMYEVEKLSAAYKKAINDNAGNIKAQKSLNILMNQQLNYLNEKDKLSQYDVDRANKLLEIEIQRLAIEEARDKKTRLRLRRNSQGNYSYQYTADEEAVEDAKSKLADLQNQLYNLTKGAYKDNLSSLYETVNEYEEKLKELYEDNTLSAQQQQERLAFLNEYYGNIINTMTQQNQQLKLYMSADTFNSLLHMYQGDVDNYKNMSAQEMATAREAFEYFYMKYGENYDNYKNMTQDQIRQASWLFKQMSDQYGIDVSNYKDLTEQEAGLAGDLFIMLNDKTKGFFGKDGTVQGYYNENSTAFGNMTTANGDSFKGMLDTIIGEDEKGGYLNTLKVNWDAGIQDMTDKFTKEGGFIHSCKKAFEDLQTAHTTYQTNLKEMVRLAGLDLGNLKGAIDPNIDSTNSLSTATDLLIKKYGNENGLLGAVDALIDPKKGALNKLKDLVDANKTAAQKAAIAANEYAQKVNKLSSEINKMPLKKTVTIEYKENKPQTTSYNPPAGTTPSGATGTTPSGATGATGLTSTNPGGGGDPSKIQKTSNPLYTVRGWNEEGKYVQHANLTANQVYGLSTRNWKSSTIEVVRLSDNARRYYTPGNVVPFKQGGYTGDWADDSGKLALLHKRELVLNQQDTEKLLSAVNIVRTLNDILAAVGPNIPMSRMFQQPTTAQSLDQNVHITASFPNVTERTEIERALESLVNRASQYAFRTN